MPDRYVKRVLDGEREAFRHIIREYGDGAYYLALSILKEEHASKDVVQTAFVNAYTNLKTFRGKSTFKTWIHRIVVNEAYQQLRKQNRTHEVGEYELELIPDEENSHQLKAEKDHLKHYIQESFRCMKPDESLALQLFYLEEHTLMEISKIAGWSESKVKVTLHRARKTMKNLLEQRFNLKPEELYL
ncbi:MAG: RNA polymerase sigma factor [Balneolaceae bacterium]|nr:MAG: RNA polymerase sigma factor [Balneolaceae bacterium]